MSRLDGGSRASTRWPTTTRAGARARSNSLRSAALRGGASVVQLRLKQTRDAEALELCA